MHGEIPESRTTIWTFPEMGVCVNTTKSWSNDLMTRPLLRGRMYALASLWCPTGVPWSLPLLRGRRGAMSIAKGSDVRPGVPLASLWCPTGVPWSLPLLRGRRGTMSIAKGSDVRPGVPLASLWCPLVSAAFAWQAWGNVHCQGVGCTPWRPSGVPLVSLGLCRFCVAGVGQCPLLRGRMYALASLWRPSGVPWSPPLLRGRRPVAIETRNPLK